MMYRNKEGLREIGVRIRRVREELRYSPDKMAMRLGVSRSNYSKYEYGEIFPRFPVLAILTVDFNVSLDWLIANKGPMFYREKAGTWEKAEFENVTGEIKELLSNMEQIPLLRHEILSCFHKFKMEYKDLVESS